MRRVVGIAMAILFLATIVTGIAEGHVHPGNSGSHIVVAILFIASTITHIVINRKAFVRYLSTSNRVETGNIIMRRIVCIAMAMLFLATIVIGIGEGHVHPGRAEHHIAVTIIFIISTLIHIVLNRKPFLKYLSSSFHKAE